MNRAGALVIGMLLLWAGAARAADTVYYYSSDTIHSEVVVTDASRNVVERTYYAPYGQVLNRDLRDGPGYGGHEEDPETNLVYMQQRYYDPEAGRFLSTDPVQADGGGGSFNRYAYANDNPYRYTDPTGMCTGSNFADVGCDSPTLHTTYFVTSSSKLYAAPESAASPTQTAAATHSSSSGAGAAAGATATAATATWEQTGGALLSDTAAVASKLLGVVGMALSLGGDTPQYDYYTHYGYAADKDNFANGLRPGAFATRGPLMTGAQAEQQLALPPRLTPPNSYYTVRIMKDMVPVIGPGIVAPRYGRPGGGIEYQFPEGTPSGSVTGPFPLPPQE